VCVKFIIITGERKAMKKQLKGWKKLLYSASIGIAFIGCFILLIFTFLINDALDKTRNAVLGNIDGLDSSMRGVESALAAAEKELNTTNSTLEGLEKSFGPLSSSLGSTADALEGTAKTISLLELISPGISSYTSDLRDAASSLKTSASSLNSTALSFEDHKTNLGDLKKSMGDIRNSVSSQRKTISETRKTLDDVFGLIRIANILFFFVVISMFVILILDSAAGMI
jgi:methyl-accepting chemotaxis protein